MIITEPTEETEMDTRRKSPTNHKNSKFDDLTAEEGIRQGLEDARLGRLRPAREFFAEFEAAHPELRLWLAKQPGGPSAEATTV